MYPRPDYTEYGFIITPKTEIVNGYTLRVCGSTIMIYKGETAVWEVYEWEDAREWAKRN